MCREPARLVTGYVKSAWASVGGLKTGGDGSCTFDGTAKRSCRVKVARASCDWRGSSQE